MIFTVLMLQSVQSNLPILSCTKSHHPSCWFERRPQSEVFNWVFLGLASTENLDFCLNIDVCKYTVNSEVVAQRWSVKNVFLEILQNSQENTCTRVSFLIKLQTSACNFIKKETLVQIFSCEFCEISKKNFSYRTPPVAVSLNFTIVLLFMLSLSASLFYLHDFVLADEIEFSSMDIILTPSMLD